jgi:hypothetical protein
MKAADSHIRKMGQKSLASGRRITRCELAHRMSPVVGVSMKKVRDAVSDMELSSAAFYQLLRVMPTECRGRGMQPPFLGLAVFPDSQAVGWHVGYGPDGHAIPRPILSRADRNLRLPVTLLLVDSRGQHMVRRLRGPKAVRRSLQKPGSPERKVQRRRRPHRTNRSVATARR